MKSLEKLPETIKQFGKDVDNSKHNILINF